MKIRVLECPRKTCKYRWVPRVDMPKECPNCKHRFSADWGLEPKSKLVTVKSREELKKLRSDITEWNERGRWEVD